MAFYIIIRSHRLFIPDRGASPYTGASDNEMKFLFNVQIRLDDLFSASVFSGRVDVVDGKKSWTLVQTSCLQPVPILPATTATTTSSARARTRRKYRCRRRDFSLFTYVCRGYAKDLFPQRRRTPAFRAYGNVREVRVA